jgi:predicted dehydrogenase
MKLRIGLIGQGKDWNSRYKPSLRLMQDRLEVRSVYSAVSALAESIAQDFNARRCEGFREMLSRPDIDAVLVLESEWYGIAPILAACDFGKSVFCGAEVELSPATAYMVKQRVDQSGIAFMTELPRRFAPATLRLKELIATRLGKPKLLFCHRRLQREDGDANRCVRSLTSRADRELVELIDWCGYIVGENPTWVQGISHKTEPDAVCFDYQVLSLGFFDRGDGPDTLAQVSCGAYMPSSWPEAITFRPPAAVQVCCEKGVAFVDLPTTLVWFDAAGRHQESLDQELSIGQQQFTQFHRAVTSLLRTVSGLENLTCAIHALQQAKESMVLGRRVNLEC